MKTMQHYDNDDLELEVNDVKYSIKVHAIGTYTHIPGRRYMPNGDPGYPDEDDLEIEEVEAYWSDESGNVVETTEEMDDALVSYLLEKADWENDYDDDGPDYDDYEERAIARWERQLDDYDL